MARLVCAATGKDFLKQKSGLRMRTVFWNANLGLAGVWTLITGILINVNVGSGILDRPFESPPYVGRIPGMTMFTGLMMIVFATVGITITIMKMQIPKYRTTCRARIHGRVPWAVLCPSCFKGTRST